MKGEIKRGGDLEESQSVWVGGGQRQRNIKVGRTWRMKVKGGGRDCRSYKEQSRNKMSFKQSFKSQEQGLRLRD